MADSDEPISKRLRRSKGTSSSAKKSIEPVKSHQNESQNSMLRLTDGCFQKIFEHLDIEGLCNVANVCKKFREISLLVFAEKHKEFKFEGRSWKNSVFRRMLYKFGHLITSVDASESYLSGIDKVDVMAISKYCSQNLETLCLHMADINCDMVQELFARLKKLELDMCDFTGDANGLFNGCKQLESLRFDASGPCDFVAKKYPKLEGLTFDCNGPAFIPFFNMLQLNPQLKYLHIMAMPDDIHISYIVHNTKNLERLIIRPGLMARLPEQQTKKVLLQLSKLKNLKQLTMDAGCETYAELVGPLMNAFAKAKVPLDELELRVFTINSSDIKSIQKIKTMEILILNRIERCTESDFVALATKLPLLSTLHLYFGYETKEPLTANGLTKMAKSPELIYVALIGIQNLKIDKKAFESILKAVQGRGERKKLIIDIFGCPSTCSFDVPANMLQATRKILLIQYKTEEECECELCFTEHSE